jgi:hypothetical protein
MSHQFGAWHMTQCWQLLLTQHMHCEMQMPSRRPCMCMRHTRGATAADVQDLHTCLPLTEHNICYKPCRPYVGHKPAHGAKWLPSLGQLLLKALISLDGHHCQAATLSAPFTVRNDTRGESAAHTAVLYCHVSVWLQSCKAAAQAEAYKCIAAWLLSMSCILRLERTMIVSRITVTLQPGICDAGGGRCCGLLLVAANRAAGYSKLDTAHLRVQVP